MKIKTILLFLILSNIAISANYKGIDISKYQGNVDFKRIDTSISFIIIKSTEGINLKDKKFDYNWNNVKNTKQKVYRGAYHYFRPNKSGIEQAKFFLETVQFKKGDIVPVIDVEQIHYFVYYTKVKVKRGHKIYYKKRRRIYINNQVAYHNLRDMVDYIYKHLKVKPIIYTTTSHWNSYYAKSFQNEHHHFLWIADYRKKVKDPKVPFGWNWHIWQYSPKGRVCGIKNCVDINISKYHPSTFTIK